MFKVQLRLDSSQGPNDDLACSGQGPSAKTSSGFMGRYVLYLCFCEPKP